MLDTTGVVEVRWLRVNLTCTTGQVYVVFLHAFLLPPQASALPKRSQKAQQEACARPPLARLAASL